MTPALERFLRYVAVHTASRFDVGEVPSTARQFDLARLLVEELQALGLADAAVDDHCLVTATLPANVAHEVPVVGWIAHLDTSPDCSGENVKPQIIEHYRGGPIVLKNGVRIPEDAALSRCVGHRLVTTDGTTLLGADDKSGIAAILTAVERLIAEHRPHGTIRIAFTPDEEVGNGTKYFDIERFGARYAYTVDGGLPGELNRETFTAFGATLHVKGREIHPGHAKGIMINATRVAAEVVARTPKNEAPETTEGREPYLHPTDMTGNVAEAEVKFLLRAFDDEAIDRLRQTLETIVAEVAGLFPGAGFELVFTEQYRNMREKLDRCPEVLANLETAARRAGIEPVWVAVRGGTDGSRLTEMGLPTPNIYTGGHHFHGPTEWLSVDFLEQTVETLVQLAEIWAGPSLSAD